MQKGNVRQFFGFYGIVGSDGSDAACLSATFNLCKLNVTDHDDGRREFANSSLALRLGQLKKKMATIKTS